MSISAFKAALLKKKSETAPTTTTTTAPHSVHTITANNTQPLQQRQQQQHNHIHEEEEEEELLSHSRVEQYHLSSSSLNVSCSSSAALPNENTDTSADNRRDPKNCDKSDETAAEDAVTFVSGGIKKKNSTHTASNGSGGPLLSSSSSCFAARLQAQREKDAIRTKREREEETVEDKTREGVVGSAIHDKDANLEFLDEDDLWDEKDGEDAERGEVQDESVLWLKDVASLKAAYADWKQRDAFRRNWLCS